MKKEIKFKIYNEDEYNNLYNNSDQFKSLERYSDVVFFALLEVLGINDFSKNLKILKQMNNIVKSLQNKKSKIKLSADDIYNGLAAFQFDDFDSIDFRDRELEENIVFSSLNDGEIYNRLVDVYNRLCIEISKKKFKSFLDYSQFQDRVS